MQPLKTRTADAAVGRWPGILAALGVDPRFLCDRHGPCPVCGGRDRYRFDDKQGRGTWFCSHCGAGDGLNLLMRFHGWSFGKAAKEVDQIIGTVQAGPVMTARTEESKLEALRTVWSGSRQVITGDPVQLYLKRRTGIDVVPAALRFHPCLRHPDGGAYPAMIALMRYPDGSSAGLHRTYLTEDGKKANVSEVKMFMPAPKPLNSAAVRLSAVSRHLGIAEGIETALAASRCFGVPVWAAGNAVLLEAWVPPPGVEQILIAGDNDANHVGQAAAYALAKRLTREGYAVEIQIPAEIGKDWADESL